MGLTGLVDTEVVMALQQDLKQIKTEFSAKADIKDVCALVDAKSTEIHTNIEDLDSKLQKKFKDQALINKNLCMLNCVGKWLWKGGFIETSSHIRSKTSFSSNHLSCGTTNNKVLKYSS